MTRIVMPIALALALLACGDGEKDSKQATPAPTQAPPATTPAPPEADPGSAPTAPGIPTLPPGMPSGIPGGTPPGMPDLSKMGGGGALDLNADTGIPECNEVFAFVRDQFLTCEKIPRFQRDMMRSNMGALNLAIRQGMALSSDTKRAEMVEACKKGLASARQDHEKHCK